MMMAKSITAFNEEEKMNKPVKIGRFVGTSANDGSGTGVCDSLFEGERPADGAGGETLGER